MFALVSGLRGGEGRRDTMGGAGNRNGRQPGGGGGGAGRDASRHVSPGEMLSVWSVESIERSVAHSEIVEIYI